MLGFEKGIREHDLKKIEFTLPKDASIQCLSIAANWFLRKIFSEIFIFIPTKNSTPIVYISL